MASATAHFLHSLTLENFMLHRSTEIDLSSHPIILITGANGSGKTQVLDGFILAMGEHPKRLRKGKITDAIGPFAKSACVRLTLTNPQNGGKRSFSVPDKRLAQLTDADRFTIVASVDETGLDYSLENHRGRHKVARKDIRLILNSLNLRADNKLAFTEEGTVNIFSDHSDKNKLDLLLETTGLTAYRENIANSLENIEKAARSLDPLRRKLSLEREYFESMKKTREMMKKKSDLVEKHRALVIEEAWSYFVEAKKELDEIEAKLEKKRREHHKVAGECRELEDRLGEHEGAQQKYRQQKNRLFREIGDTQGRCNVLEGDNNSNRRQIQREESKEASLDERLDRLKDAGRLALKEKISRDLQQAKAKKERILHLRKELGEHFFSPEASGERAALADVLQFHEAVAARGIAVHGPLFCELRVKEVPGGWRAINQTLGAHMFTFVAADPSQFESALSLASEMWPTPRFFIALCDPSGKERRSSLKFWEGPPAVLHFVEHILKIDIADGADIAEAWQRAKQSGQTLWHRERLYLPWPAAGMGWHPTVLIKGDNALTLDEAKEALKLDKNYQELERLEADLTRQYDNLESAEDQKHVEEQLRECRQNLADLKEQIEKNDREIKELLGKIEKTTGVYDEICRHIEDEERVIEENKRDLQQRKSEEETLEKSITAWQQSGEEHRQKLGDLESKAEDAGKRPQQIRPPAVVTQQRIHLEGKLETYHISSMINEEDYLAQEEKVQRLETELSGSSDHLQNLKKDVETRFSHWHAEVTESIKALSQAMNTLLSGVVQGVRLRVDNLKDPEHAGLHIEVKRHTQNWHDLSQLSGGEKVLTIEALILSLHLQADSPVHAIDECTQRLDMKFKAQAFEMVQTAVMELGRISSGPFAPQFILLAPDTLGIDFGSDFHRYFKQVVLGPAHIQKGEKRHVQVIEKGE